MGENIYFASSFRQTYLENRIVCKVFRLRVGSKQKYKRPNAWNLKGTAAVWMCKTVASVMIFDCILALWIF